MVVLKHIDVDDDEDAELSKILSCLCKLDEICFGNVALLILQLWRFVLIQIHLKHACVDDDEKDDDVHHDGDDIDDDDAGDEDESHYDGDDDDEDNMMVVGTSYILKISTSWS